MKRKKSSKYLGELERLKELNAINAVLKKSDIENAALTNASKDSEVVSDTAIDNMLDQLNLNKNANKDLEIIESLTSQKRNENILKKKHIKISRTGKGIRIRRKVHARKIKPKSTKRKKR